MFATTSVVGSKMDFLGSKFFGNSNGGLSVEGSQVGLYDCDFEHNYCSDDGGAMIASNSGVSMKNCSFFSNSADGFGGMLYLSFGTYWMENCTVKNHTTGLSPIVAVRAALTVTHSSFEGNSGARGGVFWTSLSRLLVRDSSFVENHASEGGVVFAEGGENGKNTLVFTGCQFVNNSADYSAGAVSLSGMEGLFHNCSFSDNKVSLERSSQLSLGGALLLKESNTSITDCLFSKNLAFGGSGGAIAGFKFLF